MTNQNRVTPTHRVGTYKVLGARGDIYFAGSVCSCAGFRYRRRCKHLGWVAEYEAAHQVELEANRQQQLDDLFR